VGRSRSRAGSRAAEDEFGVLSSPPPMPVSQKSMPSSPRSRRPTDVQGLGVSTPHPPLLRELGDETLGGIVVTRTTTLKVEDGGAGAVKRRWEEMSVDEVWGEVKKERLYPHPRTAGAVAFSTQAPPTQPLPPTPVARLLALHLLVCNNHKLKPNLLPRHHCHSNQLPPNQLYPDLQKKTLVRRCLI